MVGWTMKAAAILEMVFIMQALPAQIFFVSFFAYLAGFSRGAAWEVRSFPHQIRVPLVAEGPPLNRGAAIGAAAAGGHGAALGAAVGEPSVR